MNQWEILCKEKEIEKYMDGRSLRKVEPGAREMPQEWELLKVVEIEKQWWGSDWNTTGNITVTFLDC